MELKNYVARHREIDFLFVLITHSWEIESCYIRQTDRGVVKMLNFSIFWVFLEDIKILRSSNTHSAYTSSNDENIHSLSISSMMLKNFIIFWHEWWHSKSLKYFSSSLIECAGTFQMSLSITVEIPPHSTTCVKLVFLIFIIWYFLFFRPEESLFLLLFWWSERVVKEVN